VIIIPNPFSNNNGPWDTYLKDGWYLCLLFREGNAYWKVKAHEDVIVNPGATAGQLGYIGDVTSGAISAQVENTKPTLKYMLEPKSKDMIYHVIWGGTPGYAQFYQYYPANESLADLRDPRTESDEEFGFVYGRDSPYYAPNPQLAEFFTLQDMHPAWKARVPASVTSPATTACKMRYYVRKYKVELLKDTPQNSPITANVVQMASRRSFGGLKLVNAPSWLTSELGSQLVQR
jgi:hypothetical protein